MTSFVIDYGFEPYATTRQWECYVEYCKHGNFKGASDALGINISNVNRNVNAMFRKAALKGYAPEADMHKKASSAHLVKGTSTLYDDEGEVKLQWVKTALDVDKEQMMIDFANAFVEEYTDKITPSEPLEELGLTDQLTAYIIGDEHLGMRAWAEETGQDHDTDIALEDMKNAIDLLTSNSAATEIGLLVNVGDFFHANDTTALTPQSKHLLDTDGRFSHTIDAAAFILRYMIDSLLSIHNEVHIINARGNHDPDAGLWLNKLIAATYNGDSRVTVIPNESKFIKYRFGSNLIGVHHGDKIKRNAIYQAITRDWRKDIGESDHVYFWTGHVHHKQAEEIGCCLFEVFNTLAPRDYWHSASGYGASQQMESITLHSKYGIIGRRLAPIDQVRQVATS